MMFHDKVTSCDQTNQHYDTPQDGISCIAQGATGRWCVVLQFGPEYKQRLIDEGRGDEIITEEQAVEAVEAMPNSWADF